MTEKSILAYFNTPEQAHEAADKLKALRVIDVSVDRFSAYPGGGLNNPMNPLSGEITSLTAMTQNAALSNISAGILGAADPGASGMSASEPDGLQGRDIILAVVLEDTVADQAVKIIEQAGGYM
ncbi:hypothetical protein [Paenibacillus lemnae]|uniref:Uncharacterized protein n=1 Tax=Paenibacillus lemnae TaxID=1330551 RepID=A0A848M3M4_PAELE|nr:hypothetical protein [Paenibacillus lemnae]NMO94849.1 hypothetical protein [Paenibacillus lemnae]